MDKYAVCCIRKSGWHLRFKKFKKVVGHLKKGATSKSAKAIYFFWRGDPYSKAKTIISGCRYNLGDGKGLQVYLQAKAC